MIWLESILGPSVIHALSMTMLHSLWQGSMVAFLLVLTLRQIPEEKSHIRHDLSAFALFMVLVISLATFLTNLEHGSHDGTIALVTQIIPTKAALSFSPISHYSVCIWFLGVLVLGTRLLVGFTQVTRLRFERQIDTAIYKHTLSKLQTRIRLNRSIRIFESALIAAPATIGYLKPMILLPVGMSLHLTPMQLEALVAHELAHIKRSDFLLNLFFSIIEILFYYHPAVWWISSQIRHEREANCDDIAIQITGSKENYLEALLSIYPKEKTPSLSMSIMGQPRSLLKRIKRQISLNKDKSYTMEKVTALTLVLLAVIGLSFTADSQTKPAKSQFKSQETEVIKTKKSSKDKTKSKIKSKIDGQRYQMEKEDGEITLLKINGKKIDPKDYSKHSNLINHLQEGQDISFHDSSFDAEEHEAMMEQHFDLEMDFREDLHEKIELEIEEHVEKEVDRALEEIRNEDFSLSLPRNIEEHIIIDRSNFFDDEAKERIDRQFRVAEERLERARIRFHEIEDRGLMNEKLKMKLELQRKSIEKQHEKILKQGEKMLRQNEMNKQHLKELDKMRDMPLRESREILRDRIERGVPEDQEFFEQFETPNREEIQNLEKINEELRGEMDQLKEEMKHMRKQINKMAEGNSSVPIKDQNSKTARNIGSLVPYPNHDLADEQTKSISVASYHSQGYTLPTTTLHGFSRSK